VRTTLTLDPDVAAQLERVRKRRQLGLKEAVNEAMRRGLAAMEEGARAPAAPFEFKTLRLGKCLVPSLDDVSAVLGELDDDGEPDGR
jgi:hypothetical protein